MKNIAFTYTKYQQNILFTICLQENIYIDTLFVKKDVPVQDNIKSFVGEVVYYEDIPFSWRSIWKYYLEYKNTIAIHLNRKSTYRIFTWSIVNPLSRYAINLTQCQNIDLIEDGTGSYLKWGFNNYDSGIKTFLVSTFIFLWTHILSKSIRPLNNSFIQGWSLFNGCYPSFDIEKNIIKHKYFQKILIESIRNKQVINLEKDSIVFIQSAYVEVGLLNQDEYLRVHIDAIEKIKKYYEKDLEMIHWSLHPRTNLKNEIIRIKEIEKATNISIKLILN